MEDNDAETRVELHSHLQLLKEILPVFRAALCTGTDINEDLIARASLLALDGQLDGIDVFMMPWELDRIDAQLVKNTLRYVNELLTHLASLLHGDIFPRHQVRQNVLFFPRTLTYHSFRRIT